MASLILLGACTSGAASSSPSPANPATAFLAFVKGPSFSGEFTGDASITYGGQSETIHGTGEFSQHDSQDSGTVTLGSTTVHIQDITANGSDYEKVGSGPWLPMPNSHLDAALARLSSLDDLGMASEAGQSLHHLRSPANFVLLPSDLGLQQEHVQGLHGSLDIYLKDDGTPVVIKVTASWMGSQGQGSGTETFEFSNIGSPVSIEPPGVVWETFTSPQYSIAHPPGWTSTDKGRWHYLQDPTGRSVAISFVPVPGGASLTQVTRAEIAADSQAFGNPESVQKGSLGGEPATLLTYHTKLHGAAAQVVVALAIHGGERYAVVWISKAGSEASDKETFLQMLSSFQFTNTAAV